jgi:hypothetical protein
MGICQSSEKVKAPAPVREIKVTKSLDEVKFNKKSFINRHNMLFTDHYRLGQKMGASHASEVRKCRHKQS